MAFDVTQPFNFEPMKSGGGGFSAPDFGLLFGGGGSALDEYLTEDQRQQMQRQAMLQSAAALLQAGGRSATPISLGQALGSALQAGTAGYQGAQTNAIQQLMTKQKMDEYKRQVADEQAYRGMFTQMPTVGTPMTGMQAAALSDTTYGQGPSPQKAAMIGMPAPAGVATTGGMPTLTQVQRDILRSMPAKEGRAELLKLSQPDEFGAPQPQVVDGQVRMVQYNKRGEPRVVSGAMPYEAQSPDIRAVEYITGQPLAGRGTAGINEIGQYRQQIAPKTTNILNAEKKGLELAYEQGVKDLAVSRDMARSANSTLSNIDRILPALDTAITGPAADFRATLLRIGKQLNVAGADADQILRNTSTVVQGLAQQELDAASQMRGQGTLTDAERAILRRAAGGDVSLTAGELRVGLLAAQRTARLRAESHGQLLSTAVRTIPSLAQIAPMYEVPVYGAPQQNPFQNAVQQEIDRRKAAGGRR